MRRAWNPIIVIAFVLACRDAAVPTSPSPSLSLTDAAVAAAPLPAVVARLDLGTLGGRSSFAADINNSFTVVGWSQNAAGVSRAFRWTAASGMEDLGTLPGDFTSRAISITDDGQVLGVSGQCELSSCVRATTVVWSPSGEITALPIPVLGSWSLPSHFNARGDVVGMDAVVFPHAWVWNESRGKYDITANVPGGSPEGRASQVNRSGLVVGSNIVRTCPTTSSCWHGFLWSEETGYRDIGRPVDNPNSTVMGFGVNAEGTVVGATFVPGIGRRPYRWSDREGFTLLPAGGIGAAMAINPEGTAVGAEGSQALAWPREGGRVELDRGMAVAINDRGAVVGWSTTGCCGAEENRATVWVLGPGVSLPTVQGPTAPTPRVPSPAVMGADACLTDSLALASRASFFACVGRSTEDQ